MCSFLLSGRTTTIVLRGGAEKFIEEAEKSLHDAIMIVRRAFKNSTVVAGGGAIDLYLQEERKARWIKYYNGCLFHTVQNNFIAHTSDPTETAILTVSPDFSSLATDVQMGATIARLDNAHEAAVNRLVNLIETTIASGDNNGCIKTTDCLCRSDCESARCGVDINTGGIIDTFANFVWEPAVVKINAINATTEAACLILSVHETVKNPKVEGMAGQVSVAMEGECKGVELFGFEDAKDFLECREDFENKGGLFLGKFAFCP
ncbi:hypothetical protein IFM89_003523 [Coptis chinensis]|uniref:T-complex protein 1 subunit eta n=1 Tax=Coptis chinensis TaxID=261450 RepID=A0A835GVZ8_9MAGN|nr:hypothetical protein IFM89_003523 [Coptis chinensis]